MNNFEFYDLWYIRSCFHQQCQIHIDIGFKVMEVRIPMVVHK